MILISFFLSLFITLNPSPNFNCDGDRLTAVIRNNLNGDFALTNDLENIDKGLSNFSIVNINIKSIDWLFLNHKGHERMLIELKKKDSYEYNWIAP